MKNLGKKIEIPIGIVLSKILLVGLVMLSLMSCEKGILSHKSVDYEENDRLENIPHEMIQLGDKLEDPYELKNVKKAVASLYPTKAGEIELSATDMYVRFLPKDESQMDRLMELGVEMLDHPLDYEIIRDGDYYHDPEISVDKITWQYAAVKKDFQFPKDIVYEVLHECYISDNDEGIATRASWIDWGAVERESYKLTGNEDMLLPETKARHKPSGRITIVDEKANGGKPFGVAGVKVCCHRFVKFSSDYTDRDGYYQITRKFRSRVRYRLIFKNEKKFYIGFNLILLPASTSSLGKGSSRGRNAEITKHSNRKLFLRCAVNNAVYDYMERCREEDMNIPLPPKNLRIWIFHKTNSSATLMMRHGTVLNTSLAKAYLGFYRHLIKLFLPDIILGARDLDDYASVYSKVCNQLAHASHFSMVGKSYWNKYLKYTIKAFVESKGIDFGSGEDSISGYCEVAEMWAFYVQSKMYQERYGGPMPTFGTSFWFYPQIFRYLDERGFQRSEIAKSLSSDVNNREALQKSLEELYPNRTNILNQVFKRYTRSAID